MKDKKSMIMVIFIGITICLFFCFNTTVFATTGTVITSDLRLRKESTTSSEIIGLLDENQEVEILGEDGDWYKVKANNDIGYVNKAYIKVKESDNTVKVEENQERTEENKEENKEEQTTETEEKTAPVVKNQKAIIKESSSVRIMPLINGDVINTTEQNKLFTVVSNLGVWSYIENSDMSGWVLTESLNISDNAEAIAAEQNNNEATTEETTTENNEEEQKPDVSEDSFYDETKTYYVGSSSVNVRSAATKSSDVINNLSLNEEVAVNGEAGEWYIVSVDGTKGYIAKTLLSTSKKEVTSRNRTQVENQSSEESYEEQSPSAPSGSGIGNDVAAYAQQFVGYPYVYGASGPNSFDCSGFAQYVYKQYGYYLNRTADAQAYNGWYVSKSELEPGDLVFFNTSGNGIGHVGIYIGNDQFVHASTSRTGVIISSLNQSYYVSRYVTARRIA